MENSEIVIREFLTSLVRDALAATTPEISAKFAQGRFVKNDPAVVVCTWQLQGADGTSRRSKEFTVNFSGSSIENFVAADPDRLAKLKNAAINVIRGSYKAFDPNASDIAYPFQCLIDRLDA